MRFMVSGEEGESTRAMLVRLTHGDEDPQGPGFVEVDVSGAVPEVLHVRRQFTQESSFTEAAFIYPTAPGSRRQTLPGAVGHLGQPGLGAGDHPEGYLDFRLGNGAEMDQVTAEAPLIAKTWNFVAASHDATTRMARLMQPGKLGRYNGHPGQVVPCDHDSVVSAALRVRPNPAAAEVPFLWAGASDWNDRRGRFVGTVSSGKIDRAGLWNRALTGHDLHATGAAALEPCRVVINCTHPEYHSKAMLDGKEDHLTRGGRVISAGGNGYY